MSPDDLQQQDSVDKLFPTAEADIKEPLQKSLDSYHLRIGDGVLKTQQRFATHDEDNFSAETRRGI